MTSSASRENVAQKAAFRQGRDVRHALVIGGYKDHVQRAISRNLAWVGIVVDHHWEDDTRRGLPMGIDLILLIGDVSSPQMRRYASELAHRYREDVTLIETHRQWSRMSRALIASRIIKAEALNAMTPQLEAAAPPEKEHLPDPLPPEPLPPPAPEKQESAVAADKSTSPELSIRSVPETFEQRVQKLKHLIGILFGEDGFQSLMATKDASGAVRIDVERTERRTL